MLKIYFRGKIGSRFKNQTKGSNKNMQICSHYLFLLNNRYVHKCTKIQHCYRSKHFNVHKIEFTINIVRRKYKQDA